MSAIANDQLIYANIPLSEELYFIQKYGGIYHHTIADEANGIRMKDATGYQAHLELTELVDDGVPGVVPPGEASHHMRLLCQQVNNLTFPFVSPLSPDNGHHWHFPTPSI
jgi:hypothetical protein